ncbi:agamous-like MADS-box protein AGL62 [Carica papaya]|uniref:agamous-like MADS-box protein AGL62 n=1 Tax=Carica papaya TaxID=3649 RepID=UPI000B8C8FCA|nr:agamous-like MADS-box protein AGL62 [Carica papaya]
MYDFAICGAFLAQFHKIHAIFGCASVSVAAHEVAGGTLAMARGEPGAHGWWRVVTPVSGIVCPRLGIALISFRGPHVEMVKMNNQSNLQVTFSKRRAGLFKKASELSTLCGADIAIIVFSPGRKVFSFGHPSVETVVERFISGNPPQVTSGTEKLIEAHRNTSLHELNMQLTQILNQLEIEKTRSEELNQTKKANENECWWMGPKEDLSLAQLQQLKASLDETKKIVAKHAENIVLHTSNTHLPHPHLPHHHHQPHHPFFLRNSSSGTGLQSETRPAGFRSSVVLFNNPNMMPPGYHGFHQRFF